MSGRTSRRHVPFPEHPRSGPRSGTLRAEPDTGDGQEDRSIMERLHRGERKAMDELARRFWNPLVRYAEEIVAGRDAAEDVVQEALLRVWHRRGKWTPTDRLQAFLYRVTRNRALNHRRSRRTRRKLEERVPRRPSAPGPEAVADREGLRREVRAAIDSLPERRREIFILARFHGRSHREIAEILDVSRQTVANQMSSALAQLRKALERVYAEHGG